MKDRRGAGEGGGLTLSLPQAEDGGTGVETSSRKSLRRKEVKEEGRGGESRLVFAGHPRHWASRQL